jgi:peptidoglycan hydrolase CwlO-like protein
MLKHYSYWTAFLLWFSVFLLSPILHSYIYSLECKPGFTYSNKEELESIKALCEKKVNELKSQANSLSSQIQFMDTQIYLTGIRIQSTEQKIIDTENEITLIDEKIENLDDSLDRLSQQLIQRVVTGYKTQNVSMLDIFLDSSNMGEFLNRAKYQKTTQDNNQKLLIQVQESKLNFEEQKTLREKKREELNKLSVTLAGQKAQLDDQKVQKQKLLVETRSDESTYQQILAQARRQLTAFTTFVQTSGASSIIGAGALGTGSDGAYFSQRDERWANQAIGNSSMNILEVGCLLTSVSMILKKNGVDTSPAAIAANANYFYLNTAYMRYRYNFNPWPGGLNSSSIPVSQVDEELNNGHYVIAGINHGGCKSDSDHFVVLTKKEGNDYKMHDPIYGPDKNFSDHYSQVCSAEVFK